MNIKERGLHESNGGCHVCLQPPAWELGYQAQGWASIAYDHDSGGGWRWEVASVRLNLESNKNKNKNKNKSNTRTTTRTCVRWVETGDGGKTYLKQKRVASATLFFCFPCPVACLV